MSHLRGALAALVLFLGVIVAATPAAALVVPPPSLVGEQLFAGPDSTGGTGLFITTRTCNADESGTIEFSATGDAVGPYPGTFMEHGTVTVGPGTLAGAGPVTALVVTDFTITSPIAIVTGTKTLLVAPTNQGACGDFFGLGFNAFFVSQVSYSATIKVLVDGSMYRDTGTGTTVGHDALQGGFFAVGPPEASASLFEESFDMSNGVVPLASTGHVTGGGWILGPTLANRVSFGVEATANPNGLHATCTVIDHATKSQIKCKTIESLLVTGTHATFSGNATVNCVTTTYRIDVDDLGEPGTLDTFRIELGNGYIAGGTLLGGNIQIHK
jgi:hypothetical protein